MVDLVPARGPGRIQAGLLAAAVAVLVLLAAGSVQAASVKVAAMNYEFLPASRTIAVGDVVRWTFAGDPHSVTSRDGLFDSGVTDPGGAFEFKFVKAGTYRYYCQVHPEQMFGTIVVRATATPKATPRPTAQPTVKPTTTRAPTATPAPTPTLIPTPEPSASAPRSPVASETASASLGLLETPESSRVPASATPRDAAATNAIDTAPILALLIVLGLLVGGGLIAARRRMT